MGYAANYYEKSFVDFWGSDYEISYCLYGSYNIIDWKEIINSKHGAPAPQVPERGKSLEALAAKLDAIPDKSAANDILSDSVKLSEWKEQCLADCKELHEKSLLEIDISTRFKNFWTELINDEIIQSLCPPPRELTPEELAKAFK